MAHPLAEELADDILKAAGSGLKNYTVPSIRAGIIDAADKWLAINGTPTREVARMADDLIAAGSHKLTLSCDNKLGWPDGLMTADGELVAHLDLEDSQHGPRLWDFAISMLKLIKLQRDRGIGS